MIILPTGPEKSTAWGRGTKVYGAKDTALIRNLSSGQNPPISENINTVKMGEAFFDLALIAGH